jgi:hypothetical protein
MTELQFRWKRRVAAEKPTEEARQPTEDAAMVPNTVRNEPQGTDFGLWLTLELAFIRARSIV